MNNQFFPLNFIYVLRLAEFKYYVGSTSSPNQRIKDHFEGRGSAWTKKYPPIEVLEIYCAPPEQEQIKTLEMMALKGYPNVRGGSYCQVEMNFIPKPFQFSSIQKNHSNIDVKQEQQEIIIPNFKIENNIDSNLDFERVYKYLKDNNIINYAYLLALQQNKYYVGGNSYRENGFERHFLGEGPPWTQTYKPIKILKIAAGSKELEKEWTLKFMEKYGWQNVRGYSWTQFNLTSPPKILRPRNEINSSCKSASY